MNPASTPCVMVTYRIHTYRRRSYLSTTIAVIREDNEQSWLDHWLSPDHPTGLNYQVELVRRDHPAT